MTKNAGIEIGLRIGAGLLALAAIILKGTTPGSKTLPDLIESISSK